jgi:hypothetical protein
MGRIDIFAAPCMILVDQAHRDIEKIGTVGGHDKVYLMLPMSPMLYCQWRRNAPRLPCYWILARWQEDLRRNEPRCQKKFLCLISRDERPDSRLHLGSAPEGFDYSAQSASHQGNPDHRVTNTHFLIEEMRNGRILSA